MIRPCYFTDSDMTNSMTHLVVIPCYNPKGALAATVKAALAQWKSVWVVDDGGTDGSTQEVERMVHSEPGLRVLRRPINGGKGAAVLSAALVARAEGFTHILVLDADGQHPADRIPEFMRCSQEAPSSLVAGVPVFGREAPKLRLYGRKLSIAMVWFELGGSVLRDPLFGFRVYPVKPLIAAMDATCWARRYDFDPEVAVRMAWAGTPVVNVPAECRYFKREQGGISHFHYLRDNLRMVALHVRLVTGLILRKLKLHR